MTPKSWDIYNYLKECSEAGYMPTIREICSKLGYKSTSTVHRHLEELEKDGFLERTGDRGTKLKITGNNTMRVPFLKEVTAGIPITAIEDVTDFIAFTPTKRYTNSLFAMKVRGESMINAGISDGDIIIVEKQEYAENGQIVVAFADGEEATVKRFFKEDGYYRLQPENDTMEPIIADDIQIIGRVVSLIRYY